MKNKKNILKKEKKDMKGKKAQVSIEMILILTVLILGAVVFAIFFLGAFNKNIDSSTNINDQTSNTVDNFIKDLINYNDNNTITTPPVTPASYNLILTPNNASAGTANTSGSYVSGSLVTVVANPLSGYTFSNWTNASNGSVVSTNASYSFNMPSNDLSLIANFSLAPPINYTLTVSKNGNGSVTGSGINCTPTCSSTYTANTTITLTAVPAGAHQFSGWSGACSGLTTTCNLIMDSNKSVTANFSPSTLEFISTWDTTKISTGSTNNNQVRLPLVSTGTYDFLVDWGDGTTNTITTWNTPNATHTYSTPGIKTIKITGTIVGFSFTNSGDRLKLTNISKWGPLRLGNTGAYFQGAQNLTITATDVLDLNGTTDLTAMFANCSSITTIPSINSWDVSNVTDMKLLFYFATNFNSPINNWNTSNVTNMTGLFHNAEKFNQPLNNWNVSNVTNMSYLFESAYIFNQPLDNWDVSKVTIMHNLFENARVFNQPLNNWNVSNVTDMRHMFSQAFLFNQPLDNWDVSKVTNMQAMFYSARYFDQPIDNWDVSNVTNMSYMFVSTYFNQPLNSWNVSNVTNMSYMFSGTGFFNQPLNKWNVSNVTDMSSMFNTAISFNQNINDWNVSNVTNMGGMFTRADVFNQPLNNWDVSNVVNMQYMFSLAINFNQPLNNWNVSKVGSMSYMFMEATSFNQPLNNWDVSNLTQTENMFTYATSFNQPLSNWDISKVRFMMNMFNYANSFNQDLSNWRFSSLENAFLINSSSFTTSNYDKLLISLSSQSLKPNVNLNVGSTKYSSAAAAARQSIINNYNWTIVDGGMQ